MDAGTSIHLLPSPGIEQQRFQRKMSSNRVLVGRLAHSDLYFRACIDILRPSKCRNYVLTQVLP